MMVPSHAIGTPNNGAPPPRIGGVDVPDGNGGVTVEDDSSPGGDDMPREAFGQWEGLALVAADPLVHFLAAIALGLVDDRDGAAFAVQQCDGMTEDAFEQRHQLELSGKVAGEFGDAVELRKRDTLSWVWFGVGSSGM